MEASGHREAGKVFDDKALEPGANRDAEVTELHAKIGQLVVENGQPRLVRRRDLHPDAAGLSLPRRRHGLGEAKVLAWRLSNTMEADFCIAALQDAMDVHGRPEICNTDQGSQFTSHRFTGALANVSIRFSMDGRGRWMDNVFIERSWRSIKYAIKYECVFLNAFDTRGEARTGIGRWIDFYNQRRPHSALGGRTPEKAHAIEIQQENLAA